MARVPESVAHFLAGTSIAVAGVSRNKNQAANAVYRRLKKAGYRVFPLNPKASEVEGDRCHADLMSIRGPIDGVVIATHPSVAVDLVRQCAAREVGRVWFHRSFGQGSVSEDAVAECAELGVECIVGGCPLMFCEPVDLGHRCMRWWLGRKGRVPT